MDNLYSKIQQVERISKAPRIFRFITQPYIYLSSVIFAKFIYPRTHRGKIQSAKTFFGIDMKIELPSGSDILLTGGKSEDSEIRLAKFLIQKLKEGDCFFDIGAHYGYFTLLGSKIVGQNGSVYSVEASRSTFPLLKSNTDGIENVKLFNSAISDKTGEIAFYEFPVRFSEYNTMNPSQFQNEDWIKEFPPKKIVINSITIDDFISKWLIKPAIIKIDVEGGELMAFEGALMTLKAQSPILVIEYLHPSRHNEPHQKAVELLWKLGYYPFIINNNGDISGIENVNEYIIQNNLESENIVFKK